MPDANLNGQAPEDSVQEEGLGEDALTSSKRELPESDTLRLLMERYGDPNAARSREEGSQPTQQTTRQQQSPLASQEPQTTPGPSKEKKQAWSIILVVVAACVILVVAGFVAVGGSESDNDVASPAQDELPAVEPEPETVQKGSLERRLTGAATLTSSAYTDESWAALQSAVERGQAVYDDPSATQNEVDAASAGLNSAISGLEERPPAPEDYQWVPYTDVARNPESYEGRLLAYSGEVVQTLEDSGQVDIRLAVDGDHDQMLYVYYDSSIVDYRVLEGDYVTVYGECQGLYTYKTVFGGSVTIPLLRGQIVELENQ